MKWIVRGLLLVVLVWAVMSLVFGTLQPWNGMERAKAAAERQVVAQARNQFRNPATPTPAPAVPTATPLSTALVTSTPTVTPTPAPDPTAAAQAPKGPAEVIEVHTGASSMTETADIFADEGRPEASLVVDGNNIPDNYVETGYAMPAVTYTATCTGVILIQGFSVASEDLGLNGQGLFHIRNCPAEEFRVTVKDGSLLVRAEKSAICEMTAYQVLAADARDHLVSGSNMAEFCKP